MVHRSCLNLNPRNPTSLQHFSPGPALWITTCPNRVSDDTKVEVEFVHVRSIELIATDNSCNFSAKPQLSMNLWLCGIPLVIIANLVWR